ncbi:MAG TPA: sigma 54-interacting transcriptional regulator [Sedimentisphaerales bacterium]|nr:sigma 54-interacting transcriptional regulator [Sedimentisphaerales bacterium]
MGKKNTFWQDGETVASRRLGRLDALCAISRLLSAGAARQDALCRVLDVLDKELGLSRGTITLLTPDGKELRIDAVHDLSQEKSRSITYRIGEGVTGKVMETGKAAIVERISREPLFLSRFERWNVTKEEVSFICVPISAGDDMIGTVSVDRPFDENAPLDEEVRTLSIVASMIANDLRARRQVAIERQELAEENLRLRQELGDKFRPENIIGNSKAMREVYGQIQQVAGSDTTVLIRGEPGTGKELVAHAIHYASPRSAGPFMKVSCAGLNEDLLEKELFGYEKGAFAGAIERRKGRLEEANGGTLFLDEIGDFSSVTQVKLLRVLQEQRFERLDGHVTIKTNARIIAATSRDLEKAVDEGTLQQDLYCQLNVLPIFLPPLRERKDDILLLADYFVEQYSKKMGKDIRRISTPAINMMMAYHWPGNVRELENCIERAVQLSTDGVVHGHNLPPTLQTSDASDTIGTGSFRDRVTLFERDVIVDALKRCNGNIAAAARELKATARIIRYRAKELGIDCRRYCQRRG